MYQVVVERATGIIRRASYTDFTEAIDPELFEIQIHDDKPRSTSAAFPYQ